MSRPYYLAHRAWELPAAAACLLVLLLLFLADTSSKHIDLSVSALGVVPLMAAMWLFSGRVALVVGLGAVAELMAQGAARKLSPVTVGAEVAAFLLLAVVLRLCAGRASEQRAANNSLEAVAEVAQAILEGQEGDELLRLIARRGGELAGASGSVVALPEPNARQLVFRASEGDQVEGLENRSLPIEGSISGQVLATSRAIRTDDASDHPEAQEVEDPSAGFGPLLAVPLLAGDRSLGVITMTRAKGARPFSEEDVDLVEPFAALAGLSVGYARVRDRLHTVGTDQLATERPLEETLNTLAQTVVETTDGVAADIALIDADHGLRTAGIFGHPEGFHTALDAAGRGGALRPAAKALETRAVVIFEDAVSSLLADPQFAPAHGHLQEVSWGTIVTLPMIDKGRVVGVLSDYYPADYRVGDTEVALLKVVAAQLASAVESAAVFASAQEKAASEERMRLARELHDSVSQALYGIALGTQTARDLLPSDMTTVDEPLKYVQKLTEGGMAEMRALIFELRPESLEKEGLVAALQNQAAAIRTWHQIAVEATLPAEPEVPLDVKEALYRIAQEALQNITKHSGATRVELRLTTQTTAIVLAVSDNGVGFDADQGFPGHLGLLTMRERAADVHGEVKLSAAPGRGTRVCATIPLGDAASDAVEGG